MGYVYRFIDKNNDIIYIGKTTGELRIRMSGHKHLPAECYDAVSRIEYSELKSVADVGIYEVYFINKYKPKYNTASKYEGLLSCELPDLTWKLYNSNGTVLKTSSDVNVKETKDIRCWNALEILSSEILNLQTAQTIMNDFLIICDTYQAPIIWSNIEKLSNDNTDTVFSIRSTNGDAMYYLYDGLRLYNSDVFNSPVGQSIDLAESFTADKSGPVDEYVIEVGEKWLPYLHYITEKLKYEIRVRENKAAMYRMQLGK